MRGTLPNGGPGNLLAARLHQPVEATFEYYLATRTIEMLRALRGRGREPRSSSPLHFFGPHLPYIVPDEYFDLFDPELVELPKSIARDLRGQAAGAAQLQRALDVRHHADGGDPQAHRRLLGLRHAHRRADRPGPRRRMDEFGLRERHVGVLHLRPRRVHRRAPAARQGPGDVRGHLPHARHAPGAGRARRARSATSSSASPTARPPSWNWPAIPSPAVDSRSLLPLVPRRAARLGPDIVAEFHGHHFPYPQRMLRDPALQAGRQPRLDTNELYDLDRPGRAAQPLRPPRCSPAVRAHGCCTACTRLLRDRGDNFHHWMASMYDVPTDHDTTLSSFETEKTGGTGSSTPAGTDASTPVGGTR
jgi:hypothetical protein